MSALLGGGPTFARADLMPLGQAVAPPFGFVDFCRREPRECLTREPGSAAPTARSIASSFWSLTFAMNTRVNQAKGTADLPIKPAETPESRPPARTLIALNDGSWSRIYGINRMVNHAIRPVSDLDFYGTEGFWTMPLETGGRHAGDCKDYVVEKRHMLINAGYDPRALSIALVQTRSGLRHAVLLVATDRGELVMDNLSSWIILWDQTDYRWVSRESPLDPLSWMTAANYSPTDDTPSFGARS